MQNADENSRVYDIHLQWNKKKKRKKIWRTKSKQRYNCESCKQKIVRREKRKKVIATNGHNVIDRRARFFHVLQACTHLPIVKSKYTERINSDASTAATVFILNAETRERRFLRERRGKPAKHGGVYPCPSWKFSSAGWNGRFSNFAVKLDESPPFFSSSSSLLLPAEARSFVVNFVKSYWELRAPSLFCPECLSIVSSLSTGAAVHKPWRLTFA